jgi:hypothetical protein
VGLTFANSNDHEIQLTIAPYGTDGLLFDQVRHVSVPAKQSTTGLLQAFVDAEAIADVQWLRIHSNRGDVTGMCFFGSLQEGNDTAAFSLPSTTSTGLLFSGNEVVVTNIVAVAGNIIVEAVGDDGRVLAHFEQALEPNQKLLFTGSDSFPELSQTEYYIRVHAQDIRISGLGIGGDGDKTLSAQTPILLP